MNKFEFEKHKVLCLGVFNGFDRLIKYSNIYTYPYIYRGLHGWDRYIKKLNEHGVGNCHMERWYGDWTKHIKDVDTVMLSDGIRGRDIISYIHERNPFARIIIYYLNSIFGHGRNEPSKYKDLPCELVTFDQKNANDYNIKFKPYYYPYMEDRIHTEESNYNYTQDIFFIGGDKGRLKKLLYWKKIFEYQGLKCKFLILKTKHKFYFCNKGQLIDKAVPYDKIIEEIRHSRAILDFTQPHQHGLTYRPMEAMCFQKKLITNFEEITDYNFYNPHNIFRLEHDNINDLRRFLEYPYETIDDLVREEYVVTNWLDGFFVNEN
ncbi:hypothetical protein [uncultured Megasphaera sp.]|uniref:hypothetical protein n=1 Tax=Megasphaera massiliensis TaxID=1232428 RepID=UPI00266C049D|nr:hypothetical protein [uncultured Megasphaera sp.]